MPNYLVTATVLVEAGNEAEAASAAFKKSLVCEIMAYDVRIDEVQHGRVTLSKVERDELVAVHLGQVTVSPSAKGLPL